MSARRAPPHDGFAAAAEALALAALAGEAVDSEAFAAWVAGSSLPLARIADGFALDASTTALVALLFACGTSPAVARAVAAEAGDGGVPLWLATRLLPGLAAESLAAAGALRRFVIIAIEGEGVAARLFLREPIIERLSGVPSHEPEVAARIAPMVVVPALASAELGGQLHAALAARGPDRLSPVVLAGDAEPGLVAASLAPLGLAPHRVAGNDIPDDPDSRDRLARLWSREAAIDTAALVIVAGERSAEGISAFADAIAGHVVIIGNIGATSFRRTVRRLAEPARALPPAQRWERALGPARAARLGRGVARVAAQFRLLPAEIDALCSALATEIDAAPDGAAATARLWHAAGRAAAAAPVPGVATVDPVFGWDDLVLPVGVEAALRRVETHVSHATTVLDDWGFSERMGGRGRGVTALFAGPSGTGKTMAAEVLASSLDLRMMLIDLSQIISKYVGETSKNIAAAFDAAERSGAVMVWNEGDAIWGARGSVGNATDRHVNAETGDLLQRIEAFRGFTIVTTNLRHAIDPAFLRRFRFVIDFPMPAERERLRLWQRAFPKDAPVDAINWAALSGLPLSGGSIRNVALGSAFMAAARGERIHHGLISAELAEELRKHNQPFPTIDWGPPQ